MLEARGLTKVFRRPDKGTGLAGSVKHLFARRYRDKVAVDHVDLSIEAGEAVAYVGPNGAGKSTTVKLLSGILDSPVHGMIIPLLIWLVPDDSPPASIPATTQPAPGTSIEVRWARR